MTHHPLIALLCLAASSLASAAEYQVVDLGLKPSQAWAVARAIDARGMVVGSASQSQTYVTPPVLFAAGKQVDLARQAGLTDGRGEAQAIHAQGGVAGRVRSLEWPEGALFTAGPTGVSFAPYPYPPRRYLEVAGINADGVVAGLTWTPNAKCLCPFVYRQGRFKFLRGPDGGSARAVTAIDDAGHVYGQATFDSTQRATVWRNGVAYRLSDLGGAQSTVGAASPGGIVAGTSSLPGSDRRHAMRLEGDTALDLDGYEGSTSEAFGVNDHAVVVGRRFLGTVAAGFVHHPGRGMQHLNLLLSDAQQAEWDITSAVDINNAGQIAALARHRTTGRQHAVRLDPL